jgi:hypothetical protein
MNQSVASTSTPTFEKVSILRSSAGELLSALSSSTSHNCSLSFGRVAVEVDLGIASTSNQYCEGTTAGDICFRTVSSSKNILLSNGNGPYTMKVASGITTVRGNYSTLRLEANLEGGYTQIQMYPNNQITNGWNFYTSGSSTPNMVLQSTSNYLFVGWNGTSWFGVSDQRIKKNFEVFNIQALPLINALILKKYNMIDEKNGEPKGEVKYLKGLGSSNDKEVKSSFGKIKVPIVELFPIVSPLVDSNTLAMSSRLGVLKPVDINKLNFQLLFVR